MDSYKGEVIPEFVVPDKRPVGRPCKEVEKRKRGRPRKDEVLPPKKMVVHKRPQINPENRLAYAKDTVRNAERIYLMYNKPYPNPLNIDDKDLCKEAREAWEYVFSLRDPKSYYNKKDGSHSILARAIRNGEELLFLFESYCSYIRKNNFTKAFTSPDGEIKLMPIVPNQSNFSMWLGVARRAMNQVIHEEPETAVEYKAMLADLLSEGAMVGAYAASSTIFSLKNLCDWADKFEDRSRPDTKVTVEEAEKLMKELGYVARPMLEGGNG